MQRQLHFHSSTREAAAARQQLHASSCASCLGRPQIVAGRKVLLGPLSRQATVGGCLLSLILVICMQAAPSLLPAATSDAAARAGALLDLQPGANPQETLPFLPSLPDPAAFTQGAPLGRPPPRHSIPGATRAVPAAAAGTAPRRHSLSGPPTSPHMAAAAASVSRMRSQCLAAAAAGEAALQQQQLRDGSAAAGLQSRGSLGLFSRNQGVVHHTASPQHRAVGGPGASPAGSSGRSLGSHTQPPPQLPPMAPAGELAVFGYIVEGIPYSGPESS